MSKVTAKGGLKKEGWYRARVTLLLFALWGGKEMTPVAAQIVPDGTLPNPSRVTSNDTTFEIEGGTTAGWNLFHSFTEFSIPTGGEVYFNNAANIANIISRITGGKISTIDGLIRANGNANLFLINPQGIAFGPNASLNIGGSFVASSAEAIAFGDRSFFSATNPTPEPLLTLSVPIGLQYGANPGDLTVDRSRLEVGNRGNVASLALLGGNVRVEGGTLLAPGGQISLAGSIASGTIALQNAIPSLPETGDRGNVRLSQGAIADVTGSNGKIAIAANHVEISGGSQVRAGIAADGGEMAARAGDISVNARGDIRLSDRSSIANVVEAGASGNGGNIHVTGNSVVLSDGARISTVTQGLGNAGDILVNAANVDISGFSDDGLFTGILSHAQTANSGESGNIAINSDNNPHGNLRVSDRGFIATVTDSHNNGGNIEIEVNTLVLENGGQLVSLATDRGNGGTIIVKATESVTLSGSSDRFVQSPFENVPFFNLDELEFSTQANPEVEASGEGGIPYISIQRTPEQIIAGNTVLGNAENRYDYYAFSIAAPNSRAIFDVDGGDGYEVVPGSLDTEIVLFDRADGEIIAMNDDANADSGGLGSSVEQDSYISLRLEPGNYAIGVGEFDTVPNTLQLLEGNRIDRGDTYRLQVSLEHQGGNTAIPLEAIAPDRFNPNYGVNSAVVSMTQNGGNAGEIQIQTGELLLRSQAEIVATTLGTGRVGDIRLQAGFLELRDNAIVSNITRGSGNSGSILTLADEVAIRDRSFFNMANFAEGNTGDIRIEARTVQILNGSGFNNNTYGVGDAGKIIINASESVSYQGLENQTFNLVASPSARGNAGGIEVNTTFFSSADGATLNSTNYGQGNAGNITVNARGSAILEGRGESGRGTRFWSRVRARSQGNAGDINVSTPFLSMSDGPEISSRTEGIGDAGSVNVQAETIVLSDSSINSSVESTAIGNGGQVNIRSNSLSLSNGAQISAKTEGQGNGGQVTIQTRNAIALDNSTITISSATAGIGGRVQLQADSLELDNQSFITGETTSSQGGDIQLQLSDRLVMRRGSQITATAGTAGAGGDGGNIAIAAPIVVAFPTENNDITANAFEGNGGNIKLTAEGIVGLEFRSQQTPNSDITASSQFGVSGNVSISTPEVDPDSGLVELPEQVSDPTNQVAIACAAAEGNSFSIIGRGGLPEDPKATIRGQTVWEDLRQFADGIARNAPQIANPRSPQSQPPIEATGWAIDARGNIELIAALPDTSRDRPLVDPHCNSSKSNAR